MTNPRPRWFAPSSIPPILLLTAVTSFAFNHALITTQRRQHLRDHRIRTQLLADTIDFNSRLLLHLNPPSASSSWFGRTPPPVQKSEEEWVGEERRSLVRRWKALGADPVSQGLLPREATEISEGESISHQQQSRKVGPKHVTWSEIFLGNRETRSSLTERLQKVTAGIKDSFTQLTPNSPPTRRESQEQTAAEEKELEELSQLWSSASKESS